MVTATTFVVQLIGPMFTKVAIMKAGEAGLNVTEYDLMQKTLLKDVISSNFPVLYDKMPLVKVLEIFRDNEQLKEERTRLEAARMESAEICAQ